MGGGLTLVEVHMPSFALTHARLTEPWACWDKSYRTF